MNSRQKEVTRIRLNSERSVLKALEKSYVEALESIDARIKELMLSDDMQSKIYQLKYQKALRKQVNDILRKLKYGSYKTIADYLKDCYESSFFQTLYDLQGQGVPLLIPINQKMMTKAIQHDTKLSRKLYSKLGVDITKLNKTIANEITQAIATGESYLAVANRINTQMKSGYFNSVRIARTEGHRIQNESAFDCMTEAKKNGADVVKQWDATLDSHTRPDHVELDGQIREIDEPFTINGFEAMYPGDFGVPEEDINCRCAILQRARWALDDEATYEKWDNENGVLLKDLSEYDNYQDFKVNAMKALNGE